MLIVALVSVSTIAITSALGAGKGTYDWTGIWNTSRGKMVLVQKGSIRGGADVTGTVTLLSMTSKNQVASLSTITGSIVAVVMDDKLAGTWSQPPSYGPPKDAGDISFIISKDGKSFTGTWRYGYATGTPPDGQWTGTRVGPAKPPQNPPSVPLSKQTVSASAKPSITEGSVFKRAEFTIGGTQPLTIKVIQPAENFAIKEAYGKVVYQVVDGKSWGSKTLEPGDYVLSCNGGGAMGLMSASVSIEYPVAAAPPTGQGGGYPGN